MLSPDRRLLEADLKSAPFRNGVAKGLWGQVLGDAFPPETDWPMVYFWMAAVPRTGAPDRYYVALNLEGYNVVPPTGPLWDSGTKRTLELAKWPKGKPGTRFATVFRTDGFTFAGRALYHPYDRSPVSDHADWKNDRPRWTDSHTIVDYLEEFQTLLMSEDYIGI